MVLSILRIQEMWSAVQIACDTVLTVVPTSVRIQIVLRGISGEEIMAWPDARPYLRLCDLVIPSASALDKVLKQDRLLEKHDRIWMEEESLSVELTMVRSYGDEDSEGDSHDIHDLDESSGDDYDFDDADIDPYGLGLVLQRVYANREAN